MFKLNVFLIRFLPYLYTAMIWLNLITSKTFRSSCLQVFYKIGVFEKLAKFIGKHLCWSHFLLKLHMCFPIIFVKFSRTPISQLLFKIKQRLCVNKLAKQHNRDSCTCVNIFWSIYHFFSKSKGRILDKLRISFKEGFHFFLTRILLTQANRITIYFFIASCIIA